MCVPPEEILWSQIQESDAIDLNCTDVGLVPLSWGQPGGEGTFTLD